MPPLNRQTSIALVGHLLDVADLAVGAAGEHHDVEGRGHVENLLVDGQDRDFAAAAGGRPVDRQLSLGFVAHAGTSIASSCSLTISSRACSRSPFSCQLAGQLSGPSRFTSSTSLVMASASRWPFGGRGPDQLHAVRLDAHRRQRVLHHGEAPHGLVVLLDVVALARMAAGDHHAVGAVGQGLEDERRIDPPAAHHADDPHVRRILDARRAGQVGRPVRTPVAEEADDFRLEVFVGHGMLVA